MHSRLEALMALIPIHATQGKTRTREFAAILLVFCLVALHVVLVNQYFAL